MNKKIKILHLEDSLKDSELIQSIIESGGIVHDYFLAENEKEYLQILEKENIDIILSDYNLPDYNGNEALKIAREKYSHIPFIFISGTIGEDAAINSMLNGASDYVMKNKLVRLVPAIKRVLREYEIEKNRKMAEEALLENEKKFRSYIENAPDGVFVVDDTGRFVEINKAVSSILGYSEEEILKISISDLLAKESLEEGITHFNKLIETGKAISDLLYKHKDGSSRWLSINSVKLSETGFLGFCKDITERKIAEKQISDLAKFPEENSNLVYRISKNGTLLYANPASRKIIPDFFPDSGKKILVQWIKKIKEIYDSGQRRTEEIAIGETVFLFEMVPLTESGYVNIYGTDITDRKKAELALQESKEFLDKIINSVGSPIFVKDIEHKFCLINNALCEMLGFPSDKIIGTTGYEYLPEDQMRVFLDKDREVFDTGIENINEELLTDGAGKVRTIITIKTLYTDFSGNRFLVGVINDVTKLKLSEKDLIKAKEKAEESDRLKTIFLANMSHEIRTPMNGILGFTELLKDPDLTGEKQKDFINTIEKSGQRLLNIINDIINISKVESNTTDVVISRTNINEQIDYLFKLFSPEADKKGLQLIHNALAIPDATLMTDMEKLYAILANLIKNAVKFTSKGSVAFGYEIIGDEIRFFVKDTGIGIRHDQLDVVFERFRQVSEGFARSFEGAGLGLSISKAYVEMLGGKIWVESELGTGSTFFFTLPYNYSVEDKNVIAQAASYQNVQNQLTKVKIMIAEDDEASEKLIRIIVEKFTKKVLVVRNGIDAVTTCHNNPDIDLILMDIQMPGMNGYEATRKIREFNKNVIIIAQTAFTMAGDKDRAFEAGCNDHISKPINFRGLKNLIEKYF